MDGDNIFDSDNMFVGDTMIEYCIIMNGENMIGWIGMGNTKMTHSSLRLERIKIGIKVR